MMTGTQGTEDLTFRELLRVSQDASGRMASTAEQHEDHVRDCEANGWVLHPGPYAEDGAVSASKFSKKVRKGFTSLLSDLNHGRFDADVLAVWEPSRGSRRAGEWASLLDLLEDRGVRVWVSSHQRLYDPANPRDRRSLMEDAVDAEYEVGKSSLRVRRAQAAMAEQGRPNGLVPYGYKRVYDETNRRKFGQVPELAEAEVVRELFRRIDKGHSLRAIARDFEQRGIRTRTGKVFTAQHLRNLATKESYAGIRVHVPTTSGTAAGSARGSAKPVVARTKATWPALVKPELFNRVQAVLSDPSRKTWRPGRGKHLLSMLVFCGPCGGKLTVRYRNGNRYYYCRDRSCVRIDADELDQLAEDVIVAYLDRDDVRAKLAAADATGPELDQARADLIQIKNELDDLYTRCGSGELSAAALAKVEPGMLRRQDELQQRVNELSAGSGLAGILQPGSAVSRRWAELPISARREVVRLVLRPDRVGQLRVDRAGSHGPKPAPLHERVTWNRGNHQGNDQEPGHQKRDKP